MFLHSPLKKEEEEGKKSLVMRLLASQGAILTKRMLENAIFDQTTFVALKLSCLIIHCHLCSYTMIQ